MSTGSASRRFGDVHLTGEEVEQLSRLLNALAPLATMPQTRGYIDGARAMLDVIARMGED